MESTNGPSESTNPGYFIYRASVCQDPFPIIRLIAFLKQLVGILTQPVGSIFLLSGKALPLNHQPAESAAEI